MLNIESFLKYLQYILVSDSETRRKSRRHSGIKTSNSASDIPSLGRKSIEDRQNKFVDKTPNEEMDPKEKRRQLRRYIIHFLTILYFWMRYLHCISSKGFLTF